MSPNRLTRFTVSLCVASIALTACSSSDKTPTAAGSSPAASGGDGASKRVMIVTAGANSPYYTAMECGAKRAGAEFGLNVQLQGTSSTDPREELNVFNAVVATNPDAMVLVPWDSEAFVGPAKAFRDSGKPIVTADGVLNKPVDLQNISTNGKEAGAKVAQQLLTDGLQGTVLIVTHSPGNAVQTARTTGFIETLKNAPGVKLLDTQFAGSDASKAATIVAGAITGNPDLKLVFGTMDTIGQGAGSAIQAAGKTADIRLIGYDADPAAVQALKSGKYTGLISQSPDFMGYEAVKTLGQVMSGKLAQDKVKYHMDSPVMYLTKENIDSKEAAPFKYTGTCDL